MMSQDVFQNINISSHKYSQPVKFIAQKKKKRPNNFKKNQANQLS